MATQKQIDANRRNAEHSTGPQTVEGKAASSRNALTHGVLSDKTVSMFEEREVYQALLDQLIEEQDARTALEIALVERLANLFWRERRLAFAEQNILDRYSDTYAGSYSAPDRYIPLQDQFLIGRYQSMLNRQVRDTLRDLRDEQERRLSTIEQVGVVSEGAAHQSADCIPEDPA